MYLKESLRASKIEQLGHRILADFDLDILCFSYTKLNEKKKNYFERLLIFTFDSVDSKQSKSFKDVLMMKLKTIVQNSSILFSQEL